MNEAEDLAGTVIRGRLASLAAVWALVAVGALLCNLAADPLRAEVHARYGEYATDDAIDASEIVALGLIMSRDPSQDGTLVSYEYFHAGELFVGYQRIDVERGAMLAYGDEVDVELAPEQPGRARLAGTRRAPQAEWTRAFDTWHRWTRHLPLLALFCTSVLCGIGTRHTLSHRRQPRQNQR